MHRVQGSTPSKAFPSLKVNDVEVGDLERGTGGEKEEHCRSGVRSVLDVLT